MGPPGAPFRLGPGEKCPSCPPPPPTWAALGINTYYPVYKYWVTELKEILTIHVHSKHNYNYTWLNLQYLVFYTYTIFHELGRP